MQPETPDERVERIRKAITTGGTPAYATDPVTPDEVARHREAAAKRLSGTAQKTAAEAWLAYWGTVADNAMANLALFSAAETRNDEEVLALVATLTEAYVNLGRLTDAARLAPERAEEIARLADALERADDRDCTCRDYVIAVAHPTTPGRVKKKWFPKRATVRQLYSPRHDALVWLTECLRCTDPNAVQTLPASLAARFAVAAEFPGENEGSDYAALPDAPDDAEVG